MSSRRSGEVEVVVSFDPRARLHRSSPAGAYRVRVKHGDDVLERLLIGLPARLANEATEPKTLDEIAVTALSFVLGDHPHLPIKLGSNGIPEVTE